MVTKPDEPGGTDNDRPTRSQTASTRNAFDVIDRASLWVEKPVRRMAGSNRLNPLPHAGTISVFLLAVVIVSGLYITLFFEFGYEASYSSVTSLEANALQRTMRAVHRYSSAAMVLTTVVHGWRIFAARRFSGRRRHWRWATGMSSLLLVWLAGVTGYWLIWDRRAQAINEIIIGLVGSTGWGSSLAVNQLSGAGTGSGSSFLLVIWFVHLGLTAIIGWFMYRHLGRSKLAWLPPRHWMLLMGGSLLIISAALPVGMLGPARPEELVGQIPLDPFVLFLLPPLLSDSRWLVLLAGLVLAALVTVLPWLLERRPTPVIEIDDDACTGCELCVIDCPYDALVMVPRSGLVAGPESGDLAETVLGGEADLAAAAVAPPVARLATDLLDDSLADKFGESKGFIGAESDDGVPRSKSRVSEMIAEVEPAACVSCGICLGSCAFGAIELPGMLSREPVEVAGRHVVVACERHLASSDLDSDLEIDGTSVVIGVRCAGALSPAGVRGLLDEGARDVQLVGCPPNDCRYGIGNTLASERFSGARAPRLPRRWQSSVSQDWVAPTELSKAMEKPGDHPSASGASLPSKREALLGVGVLVVGSVLAVAFATRAPFSADVEASGVRVVVDHLEGRSLDGQDGRPLGNIDHVQLIIAGDQQVDESVTDRSGQSLGVLDWQVPPGLTDLEVIIVTAEGPTVVHSGEVDLQAGERLVVVVRDVARAPRAQQGEDAFNSRAAGCTVCHSTRIGDRRGVGPNLGGLASVAGDRVPGLDAEGYIRQSINLPDQYIVESWPSGQMIPTYRDTLSESELEDIIAYLLTLRDPSDPDPDEGE